MRSKDDRFRRLLIMPTLHDTGDVDGDELAVLVDLLPVIRFPRCFVGELEALALDDLAAALLRALGRIFVTFEAVDLSCCLLRYFAIHFNASIFAHEPESVERSGAASFRFHGNS
jgi:hypothetical protein